jgi:hypothetical protein
MTRPRFRIAAVIQKAAGVGMFYYRPDGDIRAGRLTASPLVLKTYLIFRLSPN